jgi:hypothetical protein
VNSRLCQSFYQAASVRYTSFAGALTRWWKWSISPNCVSKLDHAHSRSGRRFCALVNLAGCFERRGSHRIPENCCAAGGVVAKMTRLSSSSYALLSQRACLLRSVIRLEVAECWLSDWLSIVQPLHANHRCKWRRMRYWYVKDFPLPTRTRDMACSPGRGLRPKYPDLSLVLCSLRSTPVLRRRLIDLCVASGGLAPSAEASGRCKVATGVSNGRISRECLCEASKAEDADSS